MRRYTFYLSVALLAFGVGLMFCFCLPASAQEKVSSSSNKKALDGDVITEKEFDEILAKSTGKSVKKTFRLTETMEYFPKRDANAESTRIRILEGTERKIREVVEIRLPKENNRIEKIWDGKDFYQKRNDGEWKKSIADSKINIDMSSIDLIPAPETTIYRFLGKEDYNNQTVSVYEKETRQTVNQMMTQTAQFRVKYLTKTKYWFSADGLLLKKTKEVEASNTKAFKREQTIYEYGLNIEIETPIK